MQCSKYGFHLGLKKIISNFLFDQLLGDLSTITRFSFGCTKWPSIESLISMTWLNKCLHFLNFYFCSSKDKPHINTWKAHIQRTIQKLSYTSNFHNFLWANSIVSLVNGTNRVSKNWQLHYLKSAQMRIFFWSTFSLIRTEYGPEKPPNLDTFHTVMFSYANPKAHPGIPKTSEIVCFATIKPFSP